MSAHGENRGSQRHLFQTFTEEANQEKLTGNEKPQAQRNSSEMRQKGLENGANKIMYNSNKYLRSNNKEDGYTTSLFNNKLGF